MSLIDIQERFQDQLLGLRRANQDVKFLGETPQSGGADINASNDDGITPLQRAAAFGHYEVLAQLIANNAVIDEPNSLGWTPLMQATRNGHVSCMEKLIASGANVLLKTRMGVDIFSLAAASGSCDAMRCIISSCALNTASLSPLCFAVLTNEPKLVDNLINIFSPNEALPSSGLTPLMMATMIGNKKMVTLLCSRSSVNTRSSLDQTAEDIAIAVHDLRLKQFNRLLGKQCTSTKAHLLRQINTYKHLIEIIKKSDSYSGNIVDSVAMEETNIANSDRNKYFNVSCGRSSTAAPILEQKIYTSTLSTDSGKFHNNEQFVDKLHSFSYCPAYGYLEGILDTQGDSNYSPSAVLLGAPKYEQLETAQENNALKGHLECRNSPAMNPIVKYESCYSTPTRKFSLVMSRGKQTPLNDSAQGSPIPNRHSYLGLYNNAEETSSPVLKLPQKLQTVASPRNLSKKVASFRSPSKHIPYNGSSNRSPLASISRKIF